MLTAKQAQILELIEAGLAENGIPPSYRELAVAANLATPSRVLKLIEALEERGFLRRTPRTARSIEVLRPQTHLNAEYLRGYRAGYEAGKAEK
jgi:repressor LexA